jgi:DNA-binding transcriptional MerR regulator
VDLMGIGEFARMSQLSPKALRLYDELGLLVPASVDPESGYRWYARDQLGPAQLIASLRQLGMPLAQVKDVVGAPPAAAAGLVRAWWAATECEHSARRQLAAYLVDELNGRTELMYEVAVRDVPARSLLCLLRDTADEGAVRALGKEFVAILRQSALPDLEGTDGAAFLLYHGLVSADSDGPVEWCKPVPADRAEELAAAVPALTLRTEPAHQEAYVHLGRAPIQQTQMQLVTQTLRAWAAQQQRQPSQLGVRLTFVAPARVTGESAPECDFAVPLVP